MVLVNRGPPAIDVGVSWISCRKCARVDLQPECRPEPPPSVDGASRWRRRGRVRMLAVPADDQLARLQKRRRERLPRSPSVRAGAASPSCRRRLPVWRRDIDIGRRRNPQRQNGRSSPRSPGSSPVNRARRYHRPSFIAVSARSLYRHSASAKSALCLVHKHAGAGEVFVSFIAGGI